MKNPEPNLNLLLAIRKKGFRQVDLARMLNVHPSVVSNVIAGRWNLSIDQKERYAKALGKRVEDLFDE